eukprot:13258205-Alexandrium_andersonii.AAC.1
MAAEGDVLARRVSACSGLASVRLVGDYNGRLYTSGGVSPPPEYRVPIGGRSWAQHLVDHATPLHRLVQRSG